MQREQRAVIGELHRIGFPVASVCSVRERCGPLGDRHAARYVQGWTPAFAAAVAALRLASRQVAPPSVVLSPGDLGVYEAIDRLVAEDPLAVLQGQAAGNRFGRQPSLQELENELLKLGLSKQAAAAPAPRVGLLTGIGGRVTL